MSEIFTLESVVSFWDVDRDQRMTLGGVFKLLQEAAIKHADEYGLGARAMVEKGESWVLNRMAVEITRYPIYEEKLKVVTWSTGIRGFRGYREVRIYHGEELLVSASTLWLYINLAKKTLTNVPEALASTFPISRNEPFVAGLDKRKYPPLAGGTTAPAFSLRYADFDGNGHLNNIAYMECLQTALMQAGRTLRPRGLEIQFVKEVPPGTGSIAVAVEARGEAIAYAFSSGADLHAQGVVTY